MKNNSPLLNRPRLITSQKSNRRLAIVRSSVRALSSMSEESCVSMYRVLSSHYVDVEIVTVNEVSDLEKLTRMNPDLVFLGMESVPNNTRKELPSDDLYISDYLDEQGIAYIGSTQTALILGRHKVEAKKRMVEQGLATPKFCLVGRDSTLKIEDVTLVYPIFIKPAHGGGGYGVDSRSLVRNFEELLAKVSYISSVLGTDSLLEEYLPGREFSVAMLQDLRTGELQALPIELVAPPDKHGTRILSNAVKSANAEEVTTIDDVILKATITKFSSRVFEALGARDYGRIDIRLDSNGNPHFLEVNLIPSLISGYGSFPKACALNIDLQYKDMILALVALGLKRSKDNIKRTVGESDQAAYRISSPIPSLI